MLATGVVALEEYLATEYDPDVDYLEGRLEERNLGERDHGELQLDIAAYVKGRRQTGVWAFIEQRIRVAPQRYRVPDICLVAGAKPTGQVFTQAPLAVIEILSPEDRMSRMQDRIDDYLAFGVPYVWLIDAASRRVWQYGPGESRELTDCVLRIAEPELTVPLAEIYAGIDAGG